MLIVIKADRKQKMDNNIILNQVIILFLIMAVGFYAKKKGIINEVAGKKLSELLLGITSPLLVISSFQVEFSHKMLRSALIVFVFAILAHVFSIFISKLLYFKYPEDTKKILKFSAIYSNCGFMGFPILASLYGREGVFYASIYVAAFNIFLWTNGVMLLSGKKDLKTIKKALLNPGIISVAVGLIIFIFSIGLPAPIAKAIEMVGSMTTPLSMLIIGSVLADADFRSLLTGFSMYYATAVRLFLIPLIALVILKLIGFTGILLGVCVLVLAMPVAATTTIFAEMYEEDSMLASRLVAFSTIASMVSIPFIVLLL